LLYKLEVNDEVNLFYQGHRFLYKVYEKKIIDPSEVHYLTDKSSHEVVTLQTCWPPGTTLKRMLVFAKRVAE
jgi:sortase A